MASQGIYDIKKGMTKEDRFAAIAEGQRLRNELIWTIDCDLCGLRIESTFPNAASLGWEKRWAPASKRSGPGSGISKQIDLCPSCRDKRRNRPSGLVRLSETLRVEERRSSGSGHR